MAKRTLTQRVKLALKPVVAPRVWFATQHLAYRLGKRKYWFGPAETSKARGRRAREGFFEKYCAGRGLDIGYGGDPLLADVQAWDIDDGDAQYLYGLKDESFDFAYASHVLEHMNDPETALRNWWRVVKPGGFLIIAVPDRDLYERQRKLPSRWNPDHKTFFRLDEDDPPDTLGLLPLIDRALPGEYALREAKVCSDGYEVIDEDAPAAGEFQLEVVIQKARADRD